MNTTELLLVSSISAQPHHHTVCLFDSNTLNIQKLYKSGGSAAPKCLDLIGQDFVLTGELGKPILHVWPLNSQEKAKNVRLILPEPPACLAVCPKNVYLAVGIGCKLYVWQLSSGKLLSVQQKNYQPVTVVKFSTDGDILVIGGQDGMLVAYNFGDLVSFSNSFLSQGQLGQVEPIYTKNDHSMPISDLHLGNFKKKSRLTTVSVDQTCRIYNLLNGESLATLVFDCPLSSVIFDAPLWNLYVGSTGGQIRRFEIKSNDSASSQHVDEKRCTNLDGHKAKVVCLALNLTNNNLVSGSEDGFVLTWDVKSGQILKKLEVRSAITNVKFVLAYKNFFEETLKPQAVLNSLERHLDFDSFEDLVVAKVQKKDLMVEDEESLGKSEVIESLQIENRRMRILNENLYKNALFYLNGKFKLG